MNNKRVGVHGGIPLYTDVIKGLVFDMDGLLFDSERVVQMCIRDSHNIENSPFRTKFEKDVEELEGNLGIGCISDYEPQPLLVQSHLGSFAIATVGKINNQDELLKKVYQEGRSHFQEMSGGMINATELLSLIHI